LSVRISKAEEIVQWKIGDRVALTGDIFPVNLELTIVGIYTDPEGETNLYFDYEYLRQVLNAAGQSKRADTVGVFLTEADRPEDVDAVTAGFRAVQSIWIHARF
jgi:hypothetical protein